MANKQEDHLVRCPYYKTNKSQAIHCEGLEDGMAIHMTFTSHAQLIDYKSRFCRRKDYNQCPLAKILNQKWGYEAQSKGGLTLKKVKEGAWGAPNDVIEIIVPAPDSHWRLKPCRCGSDNVAYEQYNGRGSAAWRVKCFDCGYTVDKGNKVRHDAQVGWNA